MISSTSIHSSIISCILVIITIIICTLLSSSFAFSSTDYLFQNTIYHTRVNIFELLLPDILDTTASLVQLQIGPNVTFMDGFEFNQKGRMILNFGFMSLVNLTITDVTCHYSPSSKRNISSSSSFIEFDNFFAMALTHFTMKNVTFIIGDNDNDNSDDSDDALLLLIDLVKRNYSIIEFGQAVLWSPAASNSNMMFFSNSIEIRGRGNKSATSLRKLDENVQSHGDFSFIRIPFNRSRATTSSSMSLFGPSTSIIFRDNRIDPFLRRTSKFRILGLSYRDDDNDFSSTTTTTTTTTIPTTSTPNETHNENINNRFALMLEETSSNNQSENENDNSTTTPTITTIVETTSENPTTSLSSSSSTVPSTTTATAFSEQPAHHENATTNFTKTTSPNMTNITTTETSTTATTTSAPLPIISSILGTRWIFYSCARENEEYHLDSQDVSEEISSPSKGFTRSQFTDFRTNFEHTVTSIQVLCESPTKTLHPHTISRSSRTQSLSRSYPSPSASDGNISSSKTFSKSKSQGLNKLYIPSKQFFDGSSALFVYSAPLLSVLGSVPLVYQNARKSLAIATVAECMYLSPKIDQQDFDFVDDDGDENEYKKKFYDSLELEPDVNPSRMLVNPSSSSSTIRDRFDSYRGSISGNLLILVGSLFLYLVVILIHSRTVVMKNVRNQDERRGTASSSFTSLLKTSITMLRFPGHWIASFFFLLAPATAFSIGALFALPSKNIKNVILDKKAPTAENGYDLYKERLTQLNPFNLGMSCLALFVVVGIAGVAFFFIYKKTKIDIVDAETLFSTGESDADTLRYDSYFQRPLISDDEREENVLVPNRKFEEYDKKSISFCGCCSSKNKPGNSSQREKEEEEDDDEIMMKESCCSKCMTYVCCCIGILSGEGETGTERDYQHHRELQQNRHSRQKHRLQREQPRNNLHEGNALDNRQEPNTPPTTSSALEKIKYTLLSFFSFSRLWSEQSLFKQRFGLVYECFSDCRFVILDFTISFFINLIGGISVNCGGNDVCCRGGMFFVIVLIMIQMIFMTTWLWNPFLSRFFKVVYFFTSFLLLLEAGLGMGVLVAVGGDKEFDYSKTFFERYTVSIDDQRLRVSVVVMTKVIQAVSFVVLLILIGQVIVRIVMIFIKRRSEERKQNKLENEKKNKEESEHQKDKKTSTSDESRISSSSIRRPPGILKKNSTTKHTNNTNNRLEDPLLLISSNNDNDDDDDQQEMKSLLRLHTHQDANISSTDDEAVTIESGRKRGDKRKKHVTFYQSPNTQFENDGSQPFPKKPKRLSSSSPSSSSSSSSSPRRKRRGQQQRQRQQQQEQNENHQQQPQAQPHEHQEQQTLVLLEQLRRTQEELQKFKLLRANERDQRLRDKEQRREEKQRHRVRLASDDCVVFVSPVASASSASPSLHSTSQRQHVVSPSFVADYEEDEEHEHAILMSPSHDNSDNNDDNINDDDDDELVQEFSQDDYNRLLFATNEDENDFDHEDGENLPVFGNREKEEDDDELPEGEEMSLDELEYFTGVSSSSFKNDKNDDD